MTDNEIIKALKLCTSEHMGCEDDCPYATKKLTYSQCKLELSKDIIDLINRQKSEIERKTTECERLEIYMDELVKQKLKQAKSEAYREFAEKVKKLWGNYTGNKFETKLNSLIKELTEKGDMQG